MPDDLTQLRLDVAKALGWEIVDQCEIDDGITWQSWALANDPFCAYVFISSTRQTAINGMPDWPHGLGACQEVLDAIEARGWRVRAQIPCDWTARNVVQLEICTERWSLCIVHTHTLPEAICRAFVQAVEAERCLTP